MLDHGILYSVENIVVDLDGTLVNSRTAYDHATTRLGVSVHGDSFLRAKSVAKVRIPTKPITDSEGR